MQIKAVSLCFLKSCMQCKQCSNIDKHVCLAYSYNYMAAGHTAIHVHACMKFNNYCMTIVN